MVVSFSYANFLYLLLIAGLSISLIGAIVGGTLGGAVALILLAAIVYCIYRSSRSMRHVL